MNTLLEASAGQDPRHLRYQHVTEFIWHGMIDKYDQHGNKYEGPLRKYCLARLGVNLRMYQHCAIHLPSASSVCWEELFDVEIFKALRDERTSMGYPHLQPWEPSESGRTYEVRKFLFLEKF